MRFIQKATTVPKSLVGVAAPSSPRQINDDIYKKEDVKQKLRTDQFNKCAYCECRLNGDFGDVEHYRPKKEYRISTEHKSISPGYYWLAYDWSNLLLACSICNRTHKKTLFPLADETKRDIPHKNISNETPLIINPANEEPRNHIEFNCHIARPRTLNGVASAKGATTIEVLKLNQRPLLLANRERVYQQYQDFQATLQIANGLPVTPETEESIKQLIDIATKGIAALTAPDGEYSAMLL